MHAMAATIAGFVLGLAYFGGLLLTLVAATRRPRLALPISLAARQGVMAIGLCAVGGRCGLEGLIFALLGVWLARGGLLWWSLRRGDSRAA